jgi:hypothetical protein
VDERGGLQRLPGTLAPEIAGRKPPHLVVHDRHQRRQGLLVALTGAVDERAHVGW